MLIKKNDWPRIEDLIVFITVIKMNSFSKAATELGQSAAYISKRIGILEQNLSAKLFHRDTRTIKLTAEGEKAQYDAREILMRMKEFVGNISADDTTFSGNLNISCSFGFGRCHLTDAISLMAEKYPAINIKLSLTDQTLDLIREDIDVEIYVGNDIKERYFARKLLNNRRILCATKKYLEKYGTPTSPEELIHHNCLFIQERNASFGLWKLSNGSRQSVIKVQGSLASNSGETVLAWALKNHGIIFRSSWEANKYIQQGNLIHILPDYYQDANIWAVYPAKFADSLKTEICVSFLENYFREFKFH